MREMTAIGDAFGRAACLLYMGHIIEHAGDAAGAARVDAMLGDSAFAVRADVTRAADVKAMVEAAHERFGGLDAARNQTGDVGD